jgi:hypothetical protein
VVADGGHRRAQPGLLAEEAARTVGGYAPRVRGDGRDLAYDVADQIRDATRSRPFVVIGLAVAATLIITSLISSGKRR